MTEQNEYHIIKADEIPCQEISDPAVLSKNPIASVKMITYNHEPYIAQAIECMLNQKTKYPFELIIGEDCSIDGTMDIILKYQKKYPHIIRVITSDKNVGMKKNSIRIGKACRGKYIAFCEGDDYWHHPYKLQKQLDYMENHPECGMVYSSYDVYHVGSKKKVRDFIKYKKWEMPKKPSISDFVEGKGEIMAGILTCTVMVRRTVYEEIIEADPYIHQSDHFLMGDTQLWAEMITKAQLHYIHESMATHTITDESATRSKDIKKMLRFKVSGAELLLYLCDKYNLPSKIRNMHEAYWYDCSLRLAFHSKNAELADKLRRAKKTFSWKEWVRYFGAKYLAIYYGYRAAALFLNLFRKDRNQWL